MNSCRVAVQFGPSRSADWKLSRSAVGGVAVRIGSCVATVGSRSADVITSLVVVVYRYRIPWFHYYLF